MATTHRLIFSDLSPGLASATTPLTAGPPQSQCEPVRGRTCLLPNGHFQVKSSHTWTMSDELLGFDFAKLFSSILARHVL